MFPDTSDLRSGKAASMWFWWVDPSDKSRVWLYQSQWSTAVRFAQSVMQKIFKSGGSDFDFNVFDPSTATCDHGNTVEMLSARGRAGSFRSDDLVVNGVWDSRTANAVGFLLCQTGNQARARVVANDILRGVVGAETVRAVLWLAYFVTALDVRLLDEAERVTARAKAAGEGIVLDTNTTLPLFNNTEQASKQDEEWWARSLRGSPVPNPVSMGGGTRDWPLNVTSNMATSTSTTRPGTNTNNSSVSQKTSTSAFPMIAVVLGGTALFFLTRD